MYIMCMEKSTFKTFLFFFLTLEDSSTLRWIQTLDPVFLRDALIRPRSMQRRKPREKLQRRQERRGLGGSNPAAPGYSDVNSLTYVCHIVFLLLD